VVASRLFGASVVISASIVAGADRLMRDDQPDRIPTVRELYVQAASIDTIDRNGRTLAASIFLSGCPTVDQQADDQACIGPSAMMRTHRHFQKPIAGKANESPGNLHL
jgi:hypothetical protein